MSKFKDALNKIIVWGAIILLSVVGIYFLGLETNWFRYGLTLEGMVKSFAVLGLIVFNLVFLYFLPSKSSRGWDSLFGIFTTGVCAISIYLARPFYLNHDEILAKGNYKGDSYSFEYRLESKNVFYWSHKETLVVTHEGTEKRFKIEVFPDRVVGGYGQTNESKDWIMFYEREGKLFVQVTYYGSKKSRYVLDLNNEQLKIVCDVTSCPRD